jgi:cell division protein SepF
VGDIAPSKSHATSKWSNNEGSDGLAGSPANGRLVTDELLAGGPVVVDFGDASDEVARSVLDFTLGSAYPLDATVERSADRTYVVSRTKTVE